MTLAEWKSCAFVPADVHGGARPQADTERLQQELAAVQAELRRCQTRLFAYERTVLALRRENAELAHRWEQARALSESLNALFGAPGVSPHVSGPACRKAPITLPGAKGAAPQAGAAAPQPARLEPQTASERLAMQLIDQFDRWLAQE